MDQLQRRAVLRELLGTVYPLLNVGSFLAVATNGLFHAQAPQATPRPYAVLQAPSSHEALPTMGVPGDEVQFSLRAVSMGPDYAEGLDIIGAAVPLLENVQPALANHRVIRMWWEHTETYPEPEMVNGVTVWNVVAIWCALVEQVS